MNVSILPTPNKANGSPRIDLNAELNNRYAKAAKSISSCNIKEIDNDAKGASGCNSSPDWTKVSVSRCIFSFSLCNCLNFSFQYMVVIVAFQRY